MQNSLALIRALKQVDNHRFQITWTDDEVSLFKLSFLQRNCPCARCIDKQTVFVDEEVKATKITSVGRYAIAIEFTSGCSKGVFPFSFLRKLALESA
jgi:DUF971 family protein